MSREQSTIDSAPQVLATDLDGTLIPLDESHQAALQALTVSLQQLDKEITFVTGRDFQLTRQAITEHQLPIPSWIICDVGSTICRRLPSDQFEPVQDYQDHLNSLCDHYPVEQLRRELSGRAELRLQEESKQGPFKLSYYTLAEKVDSIEVELSQWIQKANIPWSIIASIDPFTNDGLIDFLPIQVSKAYALEWWRQHASWEKEEIIFAGDSGNDLAALTAGYRAILVGNARKEVREKVKAEHEQQQWTNRLHLAEGHSTTGVLEGCRELGLFDGA